MPLADLLLPEFQQEMAGTRKTLERIPEDKLEWKVHPKSNTIGWVGSHIVEIPGWVAGCMTEDTWDMNPVGGEPYRTPMLSSVREMLDNFDKNVAEASQAITATTDESLRQSWSLLDAGKVYMTMPRYDVIRSFIINHTIHHRAHLCVYLRLNGKPVPALYGPSGDEDG